MTEYSSEKRRGKRFHGPLGKQAGGSGAKLKGVLKKEHQRQKLGFRPTEG